MEVHFFLKNTEERGNFKSPSKVIIPPLSWRFIFRPLKNKIKKTLDVFEILILRVLTNFNDIN